MEAGREQALARKPVRKESAAKGVLALLALWVVLGIGEMGTGDMGSAHPWATTLQEVRGTYTYTRGRRGGRREVGSGRRAAGGGSTRCHLLRVKVVHYLC